MTDEDHVMEPDESASESEPSPAEPGDSAPDEPTTQVDEARWRPGIEAGPDSTEAGIDPDEIGR